MTLLGSKEGPQGWRGSTALPDPKVPIAGLSGSLGANLQARKRQKEAEQALGPGHKRRRGDLLSGTNKGVSSRHIADLEKELTEADRQRLLESKAAAYDSLQRGERQDTDGVYAVDFAAQPGFVRGGVLEDDLEARGPGAASSLDAHRSSDMHSRDWDREQARSWEDREIEEYERQEQAKLEARDRKHRQLAEAQDEIHNPGQQARAAQTAESAREAARQRMLRKHLKRKLPPKQAAGP